ncbi:MAG: rod shape-determining protein RodA [Holosporales bacterium]|jgi:rod shape determining protein RodA|nr:rod shape-determining protein RodA [Holosporales bacterium]
MTHWARLKNIPIFPMMIIVFIPFFALVIFYSINSGIFSMWCLRHVFRILGGIFVVLMTCLVKVSFWRKYAYHLYFMCLMMLVCVAIAGKISMGAKRWLDLYFFNFQPSELMRVLLIILLAKYFSIFSVEDARKTSILIPPIVFVVLPMIFVLMQPDLGTAMILFLVGISIFFVSGVQIWKFVVGLLGMAAAAPILWTMLHEYQKNRILMFFSPEMDPNGAGYHIIQSKIALGSGGFWGKGLMNGTQCHLDFLPEKQTDFIFAALGEELGFVGCVGLILLYILLLAYNLCVSLRVRDKFNQILVFGINSMLFFYVFINISMVCGILPVVGIPLPFFSYGGSALIVLMFCQGIIFAVDIEQRVNRYGFH